MKNLKNYIDEDAAGVIGTNGQYLTPMMTRRCHQQGGLMDRSRKVLGLGILGLALLIVACSSTAPYSVYERDIITGKELLRESDYPGARDDFLF